MYLSQINNPSDEAKCAALRRKIYRIIDRREVLLKSPNVARSFNVSVGDGGVTIEPEVYLTELGKFMTLGLDMTHSRQHAVARGILHDLVEQSDGWLKMNKDLSVRFDPGKSVEESNQSFERLGEILEKVYNKRILYKDYGVMGLG